MEECPKVKSAQKLCSSSRISSSLKYSEDGAKLRPLDKIETSLFEMATQERLKTIDGLETLSVLFSGWHKLLEKENISAALSFDKEILLRCALHNLVYVLNMLCFCRHEIFDSTDFTFS